MPRTYEVLIQKMQIHSLAEEVFRWWIPINPNNTMDVRSGNWFVNNINKNDGGMGGGRSEEGEGKQIYIIVKLVWIE